jgi:hypothetical protein
LVLLRQVADFKVTSGQACVLSTLSGKSKHLRRVILKLLTLTTESAFQGIELYAKLIRKPVFSEEIQTSSLKLRFQIALVTNPQSPIASNLLPRVANHRKSRPEFRMG